MYFNIEFGIYSSFSRKISELASSISQPSVPVHYQQRQPVVTSQLRESMRFS